MNIGTELGYRDYAWKKPMRNELRHIVTTTLGTIVFMFLALSAIAILS